jgi:hypothetical protein
MDGGKKMKEEEEIIEEKYRQTTLEEWGLECH